MSDFFKSLKIVELASVLAGPSVGTFFAELGSDVIKIENKKTEGDVTRQWKLSSEKQDGISAYYSSVNYGKKALFKDLSNPEDKAEILHLIEECDIVITNFKSGSDKKLGMDYMTLKNINPRIIYADISGFEIDTETAAYDMVMQAETGFLSMTGNEHGLAKIPVAFSDIMAAHQLKQGILVAIIERSIKGGSYFVQCSLEKAALSGLVNQASNYLMANKVAQPMGTEHPNIAPYGEVYTSQDGVPFIFAIGSDKQFELAAQFLAIEVTDEFSTNQSRLTHRGKLREHLSQAAAKVIFSDLKAYCNQNNIPLGEVKNLHKVLTGEVAKEMILEEIIEGKLSKRLSTVAFKISHSSS